jgi:reactive intermediate/imine deaminase
MTLRFIDPPTLPKPVGYTQVVEAAGARTVYVSGQVALDASGSVVGQGDVRAQAQQVFANLQAALAAAGASFDDVVKLSVFVLDIAQLPAVREVRDQYVNRAHPPASTAVEVRRLARDEFLIEVEAIAVLAA